MSAPNIHGVVVAYHGEEQLDRCLSVLDGAATVTVVDNSSSAGVQHVALAHEASYVDPGTNLGFAAGVNAGLQALPDGDVDVLLLNPDAMLTPDSLDQLSTFLHLPENDRVAAVAPRLRSPSGAEQRVAWPFPSPRRAWLEAAGLGRLAVRETFVIGAVVLLRRDAIRDVGSFDERFFLYAEEADWQQRARLRGWVSRVCPSASATHVGAGTSEDPARRELLFHAAQETYIRKWYGRRGWLLYRVAACAGAAGRALMLRGERRAQAARRARLYARGPRRCATLAGG